MSTFLVVSNSITTLLMCMIIGIFAFKKDIITEASLSSLSKILISVAMPCVILFSMQKPFTTELFYKSLLIFFLSTLVYLVGGIITFLFCKIIKVSNDEIGVYICSGLFPNIIYIGMPVMLAVYGPESAFYIPFTAAPFFIVSFSIGIKTITYRFDKKIDISFLSVIKNPNIVATIIGYCLFIFRITLPKPINDGLSMTGALTTPISMLIIGAILAQCNLKQIFKNKIMYIFVFLRLVIIPACVYFILVFFIKDKMVLGFSVLTAAMPCATIIAILAKSYDANALLSSIIICISTILSLITIPIISLLL